ncbi:tetratricopeptide repeat protein [Sphaerisporangium dianthi]|uniref:Tetratricopeptide repeat protein n=1 Tax=Sphaerisporangium dianthi TaxID=1436120 RepID=A0ABV9CEQ6_9ACTN
MTDVFIASAPQDEAWVRWLADRLRETGLTVTHREVLASPGALIVAAFEQAIGAAGQGILVFSRASLADGWVREAYESLMRRSIQDGRRFIPVRIEDVDLPEFAANRFAVDFSQVDGQEADRRLAELVRALHGQAPVPVLGPARRPGTKVRPDGPRHCVLRIATDRVTLLPGTGEPVSDAVKTSPRLGELDWRLAAARDRGVLVTRGVQAADGVETLLAEYGRELGAAFLPAAVADALVAELDTARTQAAGLRLGLEISEELADLPWETLRVPGQMEPLALQSRVQVFRSVTSATAAPVMAVNGPLRILVAMAAPQGDGSGPQLDLEAELGKILDSVESARRGSRGRPGAYVRILNQGTLEAIREALLQERYHVLHISCHASAGKLLLEDADGRVDKVTTQRFIDEGLPDNASVPLLVLSGCSTALTPADQAGQPAPHETGQSAPGHTIQPASDEAGHLAPGQAGQPASADLTGLARGLSAAGVPAVLAMTAPVTDPYATALAESLYYELAVRDIPEVLPAFCDARRRLEQARRRLPPGTLGASLVEWATPALFLRGPSLPLYNPDDGFEDIAPPVDPQFADGVPLRKVGEFVGRRAEIRTAVAALRADGAGVLLHGIGGVGKSSLAAELLRRLGADAGVIVSAISQTSPDQLLDEVGRTLLATFDDEGIRRLAAYIRQPQETWADRLKTLGALLTQVPVTLLLDNFEDNLVYDQATWTVRDAELAAFLTTWIRMRGRHKLLVTSRFPVVLPQSAEGRLVVRHLGPLSWAEARKLMWRLPGLNVLGVEDQQRAWVMVGGHPRTLEYVDALLRGGQARFADVRERLEGLLRRRGIADPSGWLSREEWASDGAPDVGRDRAASWVQVSAGATEVDRARVSVSGGRLDGVLAEAVTLAVDDALVGDLLDVLDDFARRVLVGVSVYRRPVYRTGLAWPVSTPADPDPAVEERLNRLDERLKLARREDPHAGVEDLGLSAQQSEQVARDVAAWRVPPICEPSGVDAAVGMLTGLGLVVPLADEEHGTSFVVHRWTAATLAHPELTPAEDVGSAHGAAAGYWRWRVKVLPQDPREDVDDLVEARYHHHAAGDVDAAAAVTDWVCRRLHTWGAWGWEEQLHRETLSWFAEGSREQAAGFHQLGIIAQERGEYDQALEWYGRSLTIKEELGNRAGMATGYHQLGMIAQERGEYDQALEWYRRSLTIKEELGNRAGMAAGYHQLGMIAQERGEYDQALEWYRRSLTIKEELGNRAGMASGYHQLGMIAQERGEYDQALEWYRRSLTIEEELGDRVGMAGGYHQLGMIAELRGEYDQALEWYRRSLTIEEELGDRVGMAISLAQIGVLYTKTRRADEAVAYTLNGLVIFLELQAPQASMCLSWLGRQRDVLGDEVFRRLLGEHLDAGSVENVVAALPLAEG